MARSLLPVLLLGGLALLATHALLFTAPSGERSLRVARQAGEATLIKPEDPTAMQRAGRIHCFRNLRAWAGFRD